MIPRWAWDGIAAGVLVVLLIAGVVVSVLRIRQIDRRH